MVPEKVDLRYYLCIYEMTDATVFVALCVAPLIGYMVGLSPWRPYSPICIFVFVAVSLIWLIFVKVLGDWKGAST